MKSHDNLKVVETMNYCKSYKESGKPLVVCDYIKGTIQQVSTYKLDLYDENHNPVRVICEFNNAKGKAKASGATSVLEIRK